jgi:hypothetical protein
MGALATLEEKVRKRKYFIAYIKQFKNELSKT